MHLKHLEETNYDRLHLVEQFLDFYLTKKDAGKNPSPLEALADFFPNIEAAPYKGSSCFGLIEDLIDRLPNEILGVRVPVTLPKKFRQPGFSLYSHIAFLIPFRNPRDLKDSGYILLDPSFDIEIPIVIMSDGTSVDVEMKEKGIWRFSFEGDKISCYDYLNEISPLMNIYLKEYKNSVKVSLKPMIASDSKISLVSRDKNGNQLAHLNVNFNLKLVTRSLGGKRLDPICFKDILNGVFFEKSFTDFFRIEHEELAKTVFKIVENEEILEMLRHEYFKFLSKSVHKDLFEAV